MTIIFRENIRPNRKAIIHQPTVADTFNIVYFILFNVHIILFTPVFLIRKNINIEKLISTNLEKKTISPNSNYKGTILFLKVLLIEVVWPRPRSC